MISFIQVNIGSLPDWYVEEEHDPQLEDFLFDLFEADEQRLAVNYSYNGPTRVTIYDNYDNPLTEFTMNLDLKDIILGE